MFANERSTVRGGRTRVPDRQSAPSADRSGSFATGADSILELQRTAGNRAVADLLSKGQPRLEVGPVSDPYEAEADRVSRQVVQLLGVSRPSRGTHAPGPPAPARVMRRPAPGAAGGRLGAKTDSAISSARGGGSALAPDVRTSMESAFGGADFSGVRLHSGAGAEALNRKVSAEAFTVGSDIFLSGRVPDKSSAGQELLAHELTHTIQQGATQPTVQRAFWNKKKPVAPPQDLPISPLMSKEISSIIVNHPTMKAAEVLRSKGKEEEALDLLQKFWDSSLMVKDDTTGKFRRVQLSQFKPLMFTPSERRMLRIKKWRLASQIKAWWLEAVRKGEVHDPNPDKGEADYSKSVDTVTGIVDGIGGATTAGDYGAKIGDKIELMEATKSTGGSGAPSPTVGQDITSEWKSLNDKGSVSDKEDSTYEARKFGNKAEWADGIISVVSDAVSLVSSVTKVISLILDKKATKADVASQVSDSLSQASTTAGVILTAIERAQVSELTTNMFHWVPGLSIFSNGFAAISSAISLVQKAVRLHQVRTARSKVTEQERDDLKFALERVWVRSSQQVEQDSFSTAKSLTNAGLAIAEVATAGGFGIPRLAQIVVSASSAVHSFGHTIADSVRAAKSKSARTGYFAAHAKGSAEKLIRTDPLAAAETIISRASEGDSTSVDLLKSYDIRIPGLTAPTEKDESFTSSSGVAVKERMFNYSAKDTLLYQEALDKLMQGLKEDDQPKTLWDKVKESVVKAANTPGAYRDRWRQAKRIATVRNEQSYGGVKDRGTWWNLKQTVFGGEAGVRKLSETTAMRINEAFVQDSAGMAGPKAQKSFSGVSSKFLRDQMLERIRPEEVLRAKRQDAKAEAARPKMDISGPLTQGQIDQVQQARVLAQNMAIGALNNMIQIGRPDAMLSDVWQVYVAVFVERFDEQAVPVGAAT